jgi:hypothetical protein
MWLKSLNAPSSGLASDSSPVTGFRAVNKNRLIAYIHDMQRHMMALSRQAQMMGGRGEHWFQEELRKLEPVSSNSKAHD